MIIPMQGFSIQKLQNTVGPRSFLLNTCLTASCAHRTFIDSIDSIDATDATDAIDQIDWD